MTAKRKHAILVDAGYLFAQVAEHLPGKPSRAEIEPDFTTVAKILSAAAEIVHPGSELLRTYWYDAPPGRDRGPSKEQESLSMMPRTKLRLGSLNGAGQQKGVDSLICLDLSELSRNRAVDHILLCSGDEDLRVFVEHAQSFGATVSIIAIGEGRANVSDDLARESDQVANIPMEMMIQAFSTKKRDAAPKGRAIAQAHVQGSIGQTIPQGLPVRIRKRGRHRSCLLLPSDNPLSIGPIGRGNSRRDKPRDRRFHIRSRHRRFRRRAGQAWKAGGTRQATQPAPGKGPQTQGQAKRGGGLPCQNRRPTTRA